MVIACVALLMLGLTACGNGAETENPESPTVDLAISHPVQTPVPTLPPNDVLILGVWKLENVGTYRFTANGELLVTFATGAEEAYSYTVGDKYLTLDMGDRGKTENEYTITQDTLTFYDEFDQKHVLKKTEEIIDSDYSDE
ncbi:MAG: hypothetical protein ACOYI4_04780 [Christensenellales bacterium]|jgi:hypothetical protein